MDHLVMGKYQHKLFAVGIDHAEGQLSVMVTSEIGIVLYIVQIVIHKAHIPLQIETQSPCVQVSRDRRKRRALLGYGKHSGIPFLHDGVQMLDQLDCLKILLSPIHIGDPFSVSFAVVQIEHTCHRIHPDAVRMIFLYPE